MWKRISIIYLLVIVLGYILVPSMWGLTNGIILSAKLGSNPEFDKEISNTLSPTEFKAWKDTSLKEFPEEKRIAVESIVKKHLQKTDWLPSHVVSNFITFAILGLILRITIDVQKYWFILPFAYYLQR